MVRFPEKQHIYQISSALRAALWGPPGFLFDEHRVLFPLEEKRPWRVIFSPPSRAQVKNGSSCICTISTTKRLHVVHTDKFVLSQTVLIFLSRVTLRRNSLNHRFISRSDSVIRSSFLRGFVGSVRHSEIVSCAR